MKDFDPDDYRADIAGLGLQEAQENELLAILYSLMKSFVDLGWGVDSVQMLLPDLYEKTSKTGENELEFLRHRIIESTNAAALLEPPELGDS